MDAEKPPPRPDGFWGVRTPFAPSRCPVFYGWVIVFAATLGAIFSIPGQTMGFSVFTDVLMAELGLSRVELSLADNRNNVYLAALQHLGLEIESFATSSRSAKL